MQTTNHWLLKLIALLILILCLGLVSSLLQAEETDITRQHCIGCEVIFDISPYLVDKVYFNIYSKINLIEFDYLAFSFRPSLGFTRDFLRFRLLLSADFLSFKNKKHEKVAALFLGGGLGGEEIVQEYTIVGTMIAGLDLYLNRLLMVMLGSEILFYHRLRFESDTGLMVSVGIRF
jgi:hypothetical protein